MNKYKNKSKNKSKNKIKNKNNKNRKFKNNRNKFKINIKYYMYEQVMDDVYYLKDNIKIKMAKDLNLTWS